MIINGIIKSSDNILINEDIINMIISMYESMELGYEISANLSNGSTIRFENKEELYSFDNFYESHIVNLQVQSNYRYGNETRITFDIKLNKGLFSNVESTIVCRYTVNKKDDASLRNEISRIIKSCKGSLTWFSHGVPIVYLIIMLLLIVTGFNQSEEFGLGTVMLLCFSTIGLLNLLMNIIDFFVIPVKYQFGKMKEFYSKREDLTSKIFWGIIVTIIISLFLEYI